MVCANVTGFFYTVWTCFKGGYEKIEDEKSGFINNFSLTFEEKAFKLKSKIKSKFTSFKKRR